MSDNTPSAPGGSVPPKPPEPSKVQPKKETVRISLPPKPSASPTIKLPSVPAGGAVAVAAAGAPAAVGARPATSAPAGAPATATRPPTSTGPAATRPPAPTPAPRPHAPAAKRVSGLDVGLAIAAAVIALAAVGSVLFLKTIE